jgi:hypothetical protein
MERGIVINPRSLFNLVESNFLLALRKDFPADFYEVLVVGLS